MNDAFKAVSGGVWLSVFIVRRAERLNFKGQKDMLVVLVAFAIVAGICIELALAHVADNYEIEWRQTREPRLESERQMNRTFKVASDGRW